MPSGSGGYLQGEVLDKENWPIGSKSWKASFGIKSAKQDHPRPAIQSTNGAGFLFRIPKVTGEQLQQLAQQQDTTLFMTLLAVFQVLMYRYSGQTDIPVGSVIAGRQQHEVEDLIGFFVNTLVLRSEVREDERFSDFLKQVRETTLSAYDNQDVPFEKIVEAVVKDRDPESRMSFVPGNVCHAEQFVGRNPRKAVCRDYISFRNPSDKPGSSSIWGFRSEKAMTVYGRIWIIAPICSTKRRSAEWPCIISSY